MRACNNNMHNPITKRCREGLNRLSLRDKPAPQPQDAQFSLPKKAPTVGFEPTFNC